LKDIEQFCKSLPLEKMILRYKKWKTKILDVDLINKDSSSHISKYLIFLEKYIP
jgi:hypothetical protein